MDCDSVDPAAPGDEGSRQPIVSSGAKRPSVWPAFVVVVAAIALSFAAQIAAAIVLTVGHIAEGGEPGPDTIRQATEGFFFSPVGFVMMAALGQLALMGSVLVAT